MATTNFECEFTENYIIDIIYPIGSIYMSTQKTNPGNLFPNTTWTRIQDSFLAASGSTFPLGTTGGASQTEYQAKGTVQSYKLTEDEIPSHSHNIHNHTHGSDSTVTTNQDGKHTHQIKASSVIANTTSDMVDVRKHDSTTGKNDIDSGGTDESTKNGIATAGAHTHTISGSSGTNKSNTGVSGGGNGHTHSFTPGSFTVNTLPPYLAVYVWKRIE